MGDRVTQYYLGGAQLRSCTQAHTIKTLGDYLC